MAIRNTEGALETSDQRIADILNEHFSTFVEKLAGELPTLCTDMNGYVTIVTPTVEHIELTSEAVKKALLKPRGYSL